MRNNMPGSSQEPGNALLQGGEHDAGFSHPTFSHRILDLTWSVAWPGLMVPALRLYPLLCLWFTRRAITSLWTRRAPGVHAAAAAAKSLQSRPTLCDPIDGSPPGSRPWDSPGKNTGVGCHCLLHEG